MADWTYPTLDSLYADFLAFIKARDLDTATLFKDAATNTPVGAMRYDRTTNLFQEWNGTVWVDKIISQAGGGTGAISLPALGTMASQNANNVNISGGIINGLNSLGVNGATTMSGALTAATLAGNGAGLTSLNASQLATGTIAQARLGSGAVGNGTKVLLDNQTWALLDTVAGGGVKEIVHQNASMGTDEFSKTFNIPWATGAPAGPQYVEAYLKGPGLNVATNGGTNFVTLRVINATQFVLDQRASGGASGAVPASFDYTAIQYKP